MKKENWTSVTEFILLGLTDDSKLQIPLFILFLLIYIITIFGNIFIMALIGVSPRLHNPMYFLLSNLAFVDLCYSSTITPNMLAGFLSEKKAISLPACLTQMFLIFLMGGADVFILVAMAYDRYVAICLPLSYTLIMTKQRCIYLSVVACFFALLNALINTSCIFRLSFCGPNTITHFFCDVPPLLKLSCSDISLNVALLYYVVGSFAVATFILILISYILIVSSILRMKSSDGRSRAFSTCSSHIFGVILFYIPVFFMYLRPSSSYSLEQDRVASVFYTVVIPMLNPLIYSLRNQEVKGAMRKNIWSKCIW